MTRSDQGTRTTATPMRSSRARHAGEKRCAKASAARCAPWRVATVTAMATYNAKRICARSFASREYAWTSSRRGHCRKSSSESGRTRSLLPTLQSLLDFLGRLLLLGLRPAGGGGGSPGLGLRLAGTALLHLLQDVVGLLGRLLARNLDLHLARIDFRRLVDHRHLRKHDEEPDHDHLDHDERNRAPVDLPGRHWRHAPARDLVDVIARRGDAAQVEEREAEGRVHEGRLHVHAQQDSEPDEVDPELLGHRTEQRHDDERKLEEIEEEGEEEDEDVDDDEEAELPAGKVEQEMLDPLVPVDAVEREAEDARADEDENDEGRE